jgi:integrator complex subunit 1
MCVVVHMYILCTQILLSVILLLQSNAQDQILLQWKSGESATMYILSVHAMVIILAYGQPTGQYC